jgi:hypothetical protein
MKECFDLTETGLPAVSSEGVRLAGLRGFEPPDVISTIFVAARGRKVSDPHSVRQTKENLPQYFNGFPKMTFASSSPLTPGTKSGLREQNTNAFWPPLLHTYPRTGLSPLLPGREGDTAMAKTFQFTLASAPGTYIQLALTFCVRAFSDTKCPSIAPAPLMLGQNGCEPTRVN